MTDTEGPAPSFLDRLSARYEVSVPCDLVVIKKSSILGRQKKTELKGVVDELSINGARIRLNAPSDLAAGTKMGIDIHGATGVVRVRNTRTDDYDGGVIGVEFMELTSALEDHLHDAIAEVRGDAGQLRYEWNQRRP